MGSHTTQTDTTNKPYIDDLSMAETGSPKVNHILRGSYQVFPACLVWQECHHEVLQ